MASAGSAQIEATAGKTLKLKGITDKTGAAIPDYAAIMGILIGCVIAWMLVWTILGPDADGSHFEQAKVAFQSGAGETTTTALVEKHDREHVENLPEVRRSTDQQHTIA